ncbi:TonB-dependent receptor [Pararhodospirillum oryzae]|uniref:Uncharacterized protein n=1 Tax=Pararhodospirillum oryzae TaxID=478448 RepID=A0A512HA28_9PROT|nr:TonB-dependent receptor [Pararhodospirillum oryzae]GEO82317.1 hypothetical protein ROR02_24480 [Pararhodospirillum oryzae]
MTRHHTGLAAFLLGSVAVVSATPALAADEKLTMLEANKLFPAFDQWDKRGPMAIMPLYDVGRLPGDWAFKTDEWDPDAPSAGLGALDSVLNTTRPVVAGFGLTDNGEARQAFVDARQKVGAFMLRGVGTYKWAGTYQDGDGDTVRSGYGRDTEQLIATYQPDSATTLRTIFIRDEIRDYKMPETAIHDATGAFGIGMDSVKTTRYIGRVMLDKALDGTVEKVHGETRLLVLDRDNNNVDLQAAKQPGQRQKADIDRHQIEASGYGDLRLGTVPLRIGARGMYENHDGAIYGGSTLETLSAFQYPDITRFETTLYAQSALNMAAGKLDMGLRWEQATTGLGRADDTLTWLNPAGTRAASTTTARALYSRYAGTDDTDRFLNGVSAVATLSQEWMDKAVDTHVSVGRIARLPDNQELYFARYHGSSAMRHVGNPGLDPEAHYRIETGASYKTASWSAFGRKAALAQGPAVKLAASASYDYVDDFISAERASDNTLTRRNVDAQFASVNASAEWNVTSTFSTGLYGRVTWAENLDDDRGLYGVAPAEAVFLADYHDRLSTQGTWNVGLKVRAVADPSDADDDTNTGTGLDPEDISGFTVLDLYGGVQVHDRIGIRLGVSNVFNTEYAELVPQYAVDTTNPGPVNAPGRTFFLWTVMNF